jgi:hypothetical protein
MNTLKTLLAVLVTAATSVVWGMIAAYASIYEWPFRPVLALVALTIPLVILAVWTYQQLFKAKFSKLRHCQARGHCYSLDLTPKDACPDQGVRRGNQRGTLALKVANSSPNELPSVGSSTTRTQTWKNSQRIAA